MLPVIWEFGMQLRSKRRRASRTYEYVSWYDADHLSKYYATCIQLERTNFKTEIPILVTNGLLSVLKCNKSIQVSLLQGNLAKNWSKTQQRLASGILWCRGGCEFFEDVQHKRCGRLAKQFYNIVMTKTFAERLINLVPWTGTLDSIHSCKHGRISTYVTPCLVTWYLTML